MTMLLVAILALMAVMLPSAVAASHETRDERPTTSFEDFREVVSARIVPWLDNSESSLADDHAPLVAISLYEELLSIRPEPCYWDAYAAYWAVAADLRAMCEAPNREQQLAEIVRIFEDIAHAEALAELDAVVCATWASERNDVAEAETSPTVGTETDEESASARVIEIETTAALQFVDEGGQLIDRIDVSPGEAVIFRVHNSAGFDHNFHIGSEFELEEPDGTTDVGIPTWSSGVRSLEWTAPDDVSGLMFGCTVPGHFAVQHGTFRSVPAGGNASSD